MPSGWFAVPDWEGAPAGSGNTAGTKKNTKKAKSANTKPDSKPSVPVKKSAVTAPSAQSAGQFVRPPPKETTNKKPQKKQQQQQNTRPEQPVAAAAKTSNNASAEKTATKRKLVQLPVSKKTAAAEAKKRKLEAVTADKPQGKKTKVAANGKAQKPTAKANGSADAVNPFAANAKKSAAKPKQAKKKPANKTPKPLALADEASDSELAAEVNQFRKKLLAGFSGKREIGGKPDPNATFSDDDENDVDFSDSEDEQPRKKSAKNAEKKQEVLAKKVQPSKKHAAKEAESDDDEEPPQLVAAADVPAAAPSANSSFRDKLIGSLKGSRFRFLNEQLYSSEGSDAVKLFKEDRAAFTAYHEGYRQQVEQWPLNPLDRIIKSIKKLPKTAVIADFGCGEGRLAKAVPNKTYSLDLVAKRHEIIACDMAKTPLETSSIDVAVYCLSLMGTNLRDFIAEANRVLKMGGTLKIAEVESRFEDVRTFVENIKACGFQHINTDTSSKFFVFLNFKKVRAVDRKQLQPFSLKPCLYKKR